MSKIPTPFAEFTHNNKLTFGHISHSLSELDNWTDRYRQLFKLANQLPPLEAEYKIKDNLVEGCESSVWLIHYYDPSDEKHYFLADSDSKIIKGLLMIVLSTCNGQHSDSIKQIELAPLLNNLALGKYLTPSRTNGLVSVMKSIQNSCII